MFCQDLEELFGSCRVVVIAFDAYYDISIKSSTQSGRLGNAILVEFTVDDAFDINDASFYKKFYLIQAQSSSRVLSSQKSCRRIWNKRISTLLLLEID